MHQELGYRDERRELRELRRQYPCLDGFNRHHRLAKILGGTNWSKGGRPNISVVKKVERRLFNELFGSAPTPQQVCDVLNNVWIDPDYVIHFTCKPKGDERGTRDN